jgi:POT family proton-dependent oligopeptide transporter
MAFGGLTAFYTGLALIVIGTGLVKPNVSAMVGELYAPGDRRRDAGYSVYYMGINIGAFISPLICGYVGEKIEWHYGFALAGIGMCLGLVQYVLGGRLLGEAGRRVTNAAGAFRKPVWPIAVVAAALVAVAASGGASGLTAQAISNAAGVLVLALVAGVFAWLLLSPGWTAAERKRFLAVGVLFVASAMFFSVFEQAGSSLNLFAERSTDRVLFGYNYPASWFQSINALFIIALAPVLGWLWLRLGAREPSSPAKFVWALAAMTVSFFLMSAASFYASGGVRVSAAWLWATYFLHTIGELCLSPVGMSAFSKLAPSRVTGMMMGVWFLSLSVGNYMGGRVASFYETIPLPMLFATVAAFAGLTGLALATLVKPMRRMMGGVN